jgi:hypothetical protein
MAEAHIVGSGGPRLPTQHAAREPERPSLAPRLKRSVRDPSIAKCRMLTSEMDAHIAATPPSFASRLHSF